ncbi:MAG: hypothetical protein H7Z41_01375 [Cytophagales bacterium]|nr:hypothetical protein [Armatimonadota bacterium]
MEANSTITVEGKQFGHGRALFPAWEMSLPPAASAGDTRTTLRDLIANVVRSEVSAFGERQEQRQFLQALTSEEIQAGIAKGKIDMGGRGADGFARQEVDAEQSVGAALQAFEDGLYFVFVDDTQKEKLDETIVLRPGSRVTFLRLVALAGG